MVLGVSRWDNIHHTPELVIEYLYRLGASTSLILRSNRYLPITILSASPSDLSKLVSHKDGISIEGFVYDGDRLARMDSSWLQYADPSTQHGTSQWKLLRLLAHLEFRNPAPRQFRSSS